MHVFKIVLYHIFKWTGFFYLARRITSRRLRILAYHGFGLCDEDRFRPALFMSTAVFRQRMEYLATHRFPVLPLGDAVEALQEDKLPACATVITFDDGFFSIWDTAVPVLIDLRLPATIYVTTYYCVKEKPVFRLVVQYMFWRTTKTEVDLTGLGLREHGVVRFRDIEVRNEVTWQIIDFAESRMDEDQRVQLCEELGRRLEIDYSGIVEKRFLSLMTTTEIGEATHSGIDIQLHTHRHRLPLDPALIHKEIDDNRHVLEPIVGKRLRHFCYPSGIYHEDHRTPLAAAGVVSATTCDPGLNHAKTPTLTLHRFLDGNNISWIEFEAEMCGFSDLLRNIRKTIRQRVFGGTAQRV